MTVASTPKFVAVALPAPTDPVPEADVHIELRRGTTTVLIAWPGSALGELASFTRELLR
jgi:transposase